MDAGDGPGISTLCVVRFRWAFVSASALDGPALAVGSKEFDGKNRLARDVFTLVGFLGRLLWWLVLLLLLLLVVLLLLLLLLLRLVVKIDWLTNDILKGSRDDLHLEHNDDPAANKSE